MDKIDLAPQAGKPEPLLPRSSVAARLLFVALAPVAAAEVPQSRPTPVPTRTPAPTPRPTVAPTAIPRVDGTNTGLAGAASRVKLNRNVSFDDVAAKAPSPQPTKAPADGTSEAEPPCETAAFKGQIDGVVGRFKGESRTASLTPRSALAAQISKLRDIRNELHGLQATTPECAANALSLAGEWMDLEIWDLDAFLGRADPSYKRAQRIDKAWRDYESTRLLLP